MKIKITCKRVLGVMVGILPFVVVFCRFLGWGLMGGKAAVLGFVLFGVGGVISIVNFYLSFLRYWVHVLLRGKDVEYRWVSGIPLFGFLTVVGVLLIPQSLWVGLLALLFLVIDTGGIQWFVLSTWKDDSFWG